MTQLRRRPFGLACLIASLLSVALWQATLGQTQPTPPPYDPATVPLPSAPVLAPAGSSLYQQNCAACHGEQGHSDGPTSASLPAAPPPFADQATIWARSPAEYFHITKYGRIEALMPPWENRLDDDQIWQAVYYAWSLHTDQSIVQQGETLYAQSCAACHGPNGAGNGPEASAAMPRLDDVAVMSLRTQAELDALWRQAHAEIGDEWTPTERTAVLDYLRTFSYRPPWEEPYQPGTGELTGQLVQGTADGPELPSLPITLTAFLNFAPVQSLTTTTNEAGEFRFSDLATDPGMVYVASTLYQGVQYNSGLAMVTPLTPTAAITVTAYETTEDSSNLSINRANWLIDFEPGGLRVGIILGLRNSGDRTFIGEPVPGLGALGTVALAVPPGVEEIEFQDGVVGGRYQPVGDRIYDLVPVPPGEEARQIVYSYRLPVSGDVVTLPQEFLYPIENLNLLVTDAPNLEVEAPALTFINTEEVQGINFRRWSGQSLPAGPLTVQLSGIPAVGSDIAPVDEGSGASAGASTAISPLDPMVAITVGGLLVVVLAALLYLPLRGEAHRARIAELQSDQEELLEAIAELDDQYAKNEVPREQWASERAELKSELLVITQALKAR